MGEAQNNLVMQCSPTIPSTAIQCTTLKTPEAKPESENAKARKPIDRLVLVPSRLQFWAAARYIHLSEVHVAVKGIQLNSDYKMFTSQISLILG